MTTLSSLESKILEIVRRKPEVTQKELAFEANVARNTAMAAVSSLVQKGVLGERGYYINQAKMPLGFVLIKSPEGNDNIKQTEVKLDKYRHIGNWGMVSDAKYDYVFFLCVGNNHPDLIDFFSDIRTTIGPGSETHFVISKYQNL